MPTAPQNSSDESDFHLYTKRLFLRPLEDGDREDLRAQIFAHPVCVKTMIGDASTRANQDALVDAWFRKHGHTWESDGFGLWGIYARKGQSDLPDGLLGIVWIDEPGHDEEEDWVEVGYAITPTAWGKGLVTEAVRAVLDFVFSTTSAPGVDAMIFAELNPGSVRVVEKLGGDFIGRQPIDDYMGSDWMAMTHNMDLWIIENAGDPSHIGPRSAEDFIQDAVFRIGQFAAEDFLTKDEAIKRIKNALDQNAFVTRNGAIDQLVSNALEAGMDAPGWAQYRIHRETWAEG